MLNAAIIGCGKIGCFYPRDPKRSGIYTHAEAYQNCQQTQLLALCDTDLQQAKRAQALWGGQYLYTNFLQLIKQQPIDLLSICTPDATHASIMKLVLQYNRAKVILLEKPIAMTLADALELKALAAASSCKILVNYSRCYDAKHIRVRNYIKQGKLGDLVSANGCYGKGILHNGGHWFNLFFFLTQRNLKITYATLLNYTTAYNENDPSPSVAGITPEGVHVSLQSLPYKNYALFEMDLFFEYGRIRITDSGGKVELFATAATASFESHRLDSYAIWKDLDDPTLNLVNQAVACTKHQKNPLSCSLEDGIKVLEIIEQIRSKLSQ